MAGRRERGVFARWGGVLIVPGSILFLMVGCDRNPPKSSQGPRPNEGLREVKLSIGDATITVEVADTDATRMVGLMYRDSLPVDRGMLFIFSESKYQTFYMRNVKFPLDIAFLREDGTIDEIKRMKAASADRTYSQHKVRYVLEMNAGWFESHGIGPGKRVDLSVIRGSS